MLKKEERYLGQLTTHKKNNVHVLYEMRQWHNKENNLITLLPAYNSTISPLPISSLFALSCLLFFLVDQTRYFVLSLVRVSCQFESVRFLENTPTIQFVFPLFAFSFASRVVSFFFDVGVMGVTSRCLASQLD